MNTKLDFETIDTLSKAITQFAFRSGPVEDMEARNKLSCHPEFISGSYQNVVNTRSLQDAETSSA